MSSQTGWERKKAKNRVALAAAAAKLFHERGFDGVTSAEIAKAAGISERTFFRYFETKEDVLFFDIRQVLDELAETFNADLPRGASRRAHLQRLIVEASVRIAEPGEEYQSVSIATWLHEPAITRRFLEYVVELENLMIDALGRERGVDGAGDLRVQLGARSLTAAYMSAFSVFLVKGGNLPKLMEKAFAMIDAGDVEKAPPRRRSAR